MRQNQFDLQAAFDLLVSLIEQLPILPDTKKADFKNRLEAELERVKIPQMSDVSVTQKKEFVDRLRGEVVSAFIASASPAEDISPLKEKIGDLETEKTRLEKELSNFKGAVSATEHARLIGEAEKKGEATAQSQLTAANAEIADLKKKVDARVPEDRAKELDANRAWWRRCAIVSGSIAVAATLAFFILWIANMLGYVAYIP